jgi:hypothetical protein
VNDLVGVPKDIENKQEETNLFLYHRMRFGGSLHDSYIAILKIHDKAVETYDDLAAKLLARIPPVFRERMSTFFDHLRYMDSGFSFWHSDCIRYKRSVAVEDNRTFRIHIAEQRRADEVAEDFWSIECEDAHGRVIDSQPVPIANRRR